MNQFIQKKIRIYHKKEIKLITLLWFIVSLLTVISELARGMKEVNNYLIFKNVFLNTVARDNLFIPYPESYFDVNHYGIVFSLIIAPFALLPDRLGCILWCMANAALLWYAIELLPLSEIKKTIILAVTLIELQTSLHNAQFNPMMAAFIMLAFHFTNKQKEWAGTFFILAGFYIKIYGIIALSAFFFSNHKFRFLYWSLFWAVLLFCLPMLLSSPSFTVNSYFDWFHSVVEKNSNNISMGMVLMQNISVHGMLQRIFNLPELSQLWILIPAFCFQLWALSRYHQWASQEFRMLYMASCLIATVIFSSSAESSTYVIAVTGAAIWYVYIPMNNTWKNSILIFLFLFTILSPTDLYPRFLRNEFFVAYALKALPCLLVWILVMTRLIRHNFTKTIPPAHA